MPFDADAAVKTLLQELHKILKPLGFQKQGQSYTRDLPETWQVINVQKSLYSSAGSKTLTLNFAVLPKALARFREQNKAPREYECPLRTRVGYLVGDKDTWWTLEDDSSAGAALSEILGIVKIKGVSHLDSLRTCADILRFYDSGGTGGFEIERNEARIVLLAETGRMEDAIQGLREYEKWLEGPAVARVSAFLASFRRTYN
jgi:hypothetical protein